MTGLRSSGEMRMAGVMGGGDWARVDERGAEGAERGSMMKGGCVGMVGGVWREEEEQRAVRSGLSGR
jgi:hypothetical protein